MAQLAPEAENGKGGRGQTAKILAVYEGAERNVMKEAIRKARVVLKHKPKYAGGATGAVLGEVFGGDDAA